MDAGNLFTNQHRGKGVIGTLTGLLSLYLSFAMWEKFNESLGDLVGPALGVVIGTIIYLLYQTKKNEREFTQGSNYTTSETTSMYRDENGRMQQVDSNTEVGRNPVLFIAIIYGFIVLISELSWSDLLV
ncbi:MAG: hypothetical protein P8Q95_07145 [Candidatus Poseidoniaceae archaeon]|nr:hypothetical protein [Candidatus Poseidoniaceae archaeon]